MEVIGDSYSVGNDLPDPLNEVWEVLLARREGWQLTVRAIGGTGFVNGGACGDQVFQQRLAQVLADKPDEVIIEGGLNDVGRPGVAAAARRLLRSFSSNTKLVLVGPTHAPARPAQLERDVDATLASVAKQFPNCTYVSAFNWSVGFNPIGVHMTEQGHQQYANYLYQALH